MPFSYTVLHVQDVEFSLRLYQGLLGLELNQRYPLGDDGDCAWLIPAGSILFDGSTIIELVQEPSEAAHETPDLSGVFLGFNVPSHDEAVTGAHALGLELITGPYSPQEHVVISRFRGPDGEVIELMQLPQEPAS